MANYLVIAEVDTNIVHGYTAPPRIKCEQYDGNYTRLIHATLYNGDQKYTIPSEVRRITVSGIKPDGTGFSYDCTWSGAVVSLSLMRQMTVVYGEVPCNITLLDAAGNQLSTAVIVLDVERAALQDTVLESSNDFQTIIDYLHASKLYAEYSKSYAVGHTNIRTGENVDNSEYYAHLARMYKGSPLIAATAAEMTDKTRVYVYVGNEAGYTSGNWYYWNDSAWVSGGVYNAQGVQTDTELITPDVAADAEAVGNRLQEKTQIYNTVADMQADVRRLSVGMTAQTLGYYAINDGGAALYQIVNSAPTTHYEELDDSLYAKLIFKPCVTPETFGAVGNGVADDTVAVQSAIDSGHTVIFSKNYLITNIKITESNTLLLGLDGASLISVSTGAMLSIGNDGYDISRIYISKIHFSCRNVSDGIEFIGKRVNLSVLSDFLVSDFANYGISIDTVTGYNYFQRIRFISSAVNSTYLHFGVSSDTSNVINYCYVRDCYFEYSTAYSVTISKTAIKMQSGVIMEISGCDFANWNGGRVIDITSVRSVEAISIINNNFFNIGNADCIYLNHADSTQGLSYITVRDNNFDSRRRTGKSIINSSDTQSYMFNIDLGRNAVHNAWTQIYALSKVKELSLSVLNVGYASNIICSALCSYQDCSQIHLPVLKIPYKYVSVPAGGSTTVTFTGINNIPYSLAAYTPVIYIRHSTGTGVVITGETYDDTTGEYTVTLTNSTAGARSVRVNLI